MMVHKNEEKVELCQGWCFDDPDRYGKCAHKNVYNTKKRELN